jgi:hypothetical protein
MQSKYRVSPRRSNARCSTPLAFDTTTSFKPSAESRCSAGTTSAGTNSQRLCSAW